MVGLTLFLGGFSSEDKTKELGLAALFLSAVDFFSLSVSWGGGKVKSSLKVIQICMF